MLTPRKLTDNWVLIPREQMDRAAGRDHRDVTADDQAGPAGGTS